MTTITIEDMPVPTSVNAEDAADFLRVIEIGNIVAAEDSGIADFTHPPEELLPQWHDQTDRLIRTLLARRGEQVIGAATYTVSTAPGTTTLQVDVMVPREHWHSGAPAVLLAAAEAAAAKLELKEVQVWTLHPATGALQLTPKTGWGAAPSIPLSEQLSAAGYELLQIERTSAFPLDGDLTRVSDMLAEATAFAGADYESVAWSVPTPPEYRDGYAAILARLDTDAPSGDLTVDPEVWDAERIVRRDARFAEAGQTVSVAAVVHRPSGALVAFNELVIGQDRQATTHQYGTLVTREHRGHRLGTIVKCANLLRWQSVAPESPRVITFNAEENRPMLSINEALGFVPVSYAGGWRKLITGGHN